MFCLYNYFKSQEVHFVPVISIEFALPLNSAQKLRNRWEFARVILCVVSMRVCLL